MKDMDRAVKRIISAITKKERILIFGDYDVDGITATAILYQFFKDIDVDASIYIPHRIKEGYGLKADYISDPAVAGNADLIITVDCGSDSHEAVNAAIANNIDVIITDHHRISETPPSACAVVNPKRFDCDSGLEHLAVVGVVFYLLISLRKALRDIGFWQNRTEPNLKNCCDLVALGTIADIVPVRDENRILVKSGLEMIKNIKRTGISSLIRCCGINGREIDAEDVAYKIAPRLNAAGRIDHADSAFELLITDNIERATQISAALNQFNSERQSIEKKTFEEIRLILQKNPELLMQSSLVLFNDKWHEGILGIVSSRLVKEYFKPVVLITIKNGIGKGSSRSIPGIDIYECLLKCSAVLDGFGGHSMAAGLTLKPKYMQIFAKKFENAVKNIMKINALEPLVKVDCEVEFNEITDRLIDELEQLKPFGAENNEPLFLAKDIKVVSSNIFGGIHRRMMLKQKSGNSKKILSAVQFNVDSNSAQKTDFENILFRLRWNRWNGTKTAQIIIEEA